MNQDHIRNFAIIAHIDHGKSTLADRLLEETGTLSDRRTSVEQILDSNPIERERGITIKLAPVRMKYRREARSTNIEVQNKSQTSNSKSPNELGFRDSNFEIADSEYILNLIDTPGHVDFGYEVSRSLAACEGALLVVDASQGIQAQTLANLHQAREQNLVIIPVINKIDLPNAEVDATKVQIQELGFSEEEIIEISAKTGKNVESVLEAIVDRIPAPTGKPGNPLRALVFSSQYDSHKGVVVFVRAVDGTISHATQSFRFMASGAEIEALEVGHFTPTMKASRGISCGEVGYVATGLKDIRKAKVGDTVTFGEGAGASGPLAGYQEPKSMVFLRLFPIDTSEFTAAREAMEKLQLSDSSFTFRPVGSAALGNGFHCGFLGLLHAEFVQERLSREFDLNMIATAPSVEYKVKAKSQKLKAKTDKEGFLTVQSAADFPDPSAIVEVQEPVMQVTIYAPKRFVGAIMQLSQEKRGEYIDLTYEGDTATFTYLIPLSEMIVDFFDQLKGITEGYASLDYTFFEYQPVEVSKVDILVAKEPVDALSFLAVRTRAEQRGREIVGRLVDVIPRQQFKVPLQAAIGGKIIARADIKPFRKDVTQKLYGGDRTRKDKLLKKQKKGKAKMKMVGNVQIPQSAFFQVLKKD